MWKRFNAYLCVRSAALILFLVVPGLYIREILPFWSLPLLGFFIILATLPYERLAVRFVPSLALAAAVLAAALWFIELAFGIMREPRTDSVFLHIGLASWILFAVSSFCFASTLAFLRFAHWRTIEPFVLTALLCLFFWSQGGHALTLFAHPVRAGLFVMGFLTLILTQLVLGKGFRSRALANILVFVPIACALFFAVLISYNSRAVSNNGGLIQPTLFRFDFSPYLSLKNEIKLNDSLVLIVRTKEENAMSLLRRVYLAGWNPEKGFFEAIPPDERPQQSTLPKGQTQFADPGYQLRTEADQEYFIVNFDPSSFITMDYPTSATPYRLWDSRAFNGAYAVTSKISGFMPFELYDCKPPSGNDVGMTVRDLAFYTAIDSATREKISRLAEDVTKDAAGYYDKIVAINSFFHDGNYRYSLKPGTAPDGDQLSYFLYASKKGYCTYFAFSMCLMLRSLGIPARVAAGFFIQPDSGALDYYPIRANMAHAWVEVFFPHYGWISFDPTTTKVAEGETVLLSNNPAGDDFFKLLNEIIDKRADLMPAIAPPPHKKTSGLVEIIQTAATALKNTWLLACLVLAAASFAALKLLPEAMIIASKKPRRVILLLSRKLYRLLASSGKKRANGESKKAFIERLNDPEIQAFYAVEQKSRFAPACTPDDATEAKQLYTAIRNRVPKTARFRAFFLMTVMLTICAPFYPETEKKLLDDAHSAINSENWEAALSMLTEGIRAFPASPDFHYMLGTLYAKKEIYPSAYKELKTALDLGYANTEIYSELADVAGYLNEDEKALEYLSVFLADHQDDLFAWSNYGWLCYKTNRLDEGIKTLHRVITTYGPDGNLYVGLGNLYTASFNYADARKYYTLAIKFAESHKQTYLASIYYYNRSILEEAFYHFDEAYSDTVKSLAASARSSGFLMQAELELRKLDYRAAIRHYNRAVGLDSTPLASMGLAETMIQAGYPDEAMNYLTLVTKKTELSWIANYGTTTDQHQADVQNILGEIYNFKLHAEKRKVIHSFSTLLERQRSILTYKILFWYHDSLYRILNKKVAHYYEKTERAFNSITSQDLYINSFYFLAFSKWKQIANPYLDRAMAIEAEHIPEARPAYMYEKARLKRSPELMDEAIQTLNPQWERKFLAKAVAERLQMEKNTRSSTYRDLAAQLFDLNPAFFVVYDIRLPISIEMPNTVQKLNSRLIKILHAKVSSAGFRETDQAPFVFKISEEPTGIRLSLLDNNKNNTIYTQVINNNMQSSKEIAQFINKFSTNVFKTAIQP